MDSQLAQLIDLNIKGRVFALCQSRGIIDPTIIGYYIEILSQAVHDNLHEDANPLDFNHVLDERVAWLEAEIDQTTPAAKNEAAPIAVEPLLASPTDKAEPAKRATGYVPKAKSMPERLAEQRAGMQQLLEKDFTACKLITPDQAKRMKSKLLGREPVQAEQELLAELRQILHQQIRQFIRDNDGGPWNSPTLQNELREDIAATRSLRSLRTLCRELFYERKEWLDKNKTGIAGRLFGGKIRFKK